METILEHVDQGIVRQLILFKILQCLARKFSWVRQEEDASTYQREIIFIFNIKTKITEHARFHTFSAKHASGSA